MIGPVGLEAGNRSRHRAGSQHNTGAADGRHTVGTGDSDGAIGPERTDPVEDRDLLRLHEAGEALDDAVDDLLLARLGRDEVHDGRAGFDTELAGMGDMALDRCRLEERLRRDAPPVEARTTHLAHLDEGDAETGRGGVQRSAVSAGTTADHDEIKICCGLHVGSVGSVSRPERSCQNSVATVAPSRAERAPNAAGRRLGGRSAVEQYRSSRPSRKVSAQSAGAMVIPSHVDDDTATTLPGPTRVKPARPLGSSIPPTRTVATSCDASTRDDTSSTVTSPALPGSPTANSVVLCC